MAVPDHMLIWGLYMDVKGSLFSKFLLFFGIPANFVNPLGTFFLVWGGWRRFWDEFWAMPIKGALCKTLKFLTPTLKKVDGLSL